MPADALGLGFGFVIVFGLLVVACIVLTFAILVLVAVRVTAYGTVAGLPLAAIAGVGTHRWSGDVFVLVSACFGGLLLGVAIGRYRWPVTEPPGFVRQPAYRLLVLAIGTAAIGAGVGVWVVLVGTAGPALFVESVAGSPRTLLGLLAVTGAPIIGGALAFNSIR